MSLIKCLKKLGFSEFEAEVLKQDTQDLTADGLPAKDAAIQAIQDRIGEYAEERGQIIDQLKAQGVVIPEVAEATTPPLIAKLIEGFEYFKKDQAEQRPAKVMRYSDDRVETTIQNLARTDGTVAGVMAYIDPVDFVNLTVKFPEELSMYGEIRQLDMTDLRAEPQSPFLGISPDGNVHRHEGRHRMAALANAGYTQVPVTLVMYDEQGNARQPGKVDLPEGFLLSGEDFGETANLRDRKAAIRNPVNITHWNKDQLKAEFGQAGEEYFQEAGDIFYSGLLDATENLKQAKGNPDQMLAMLKKQGVKQEEIEWLGLEEWIKEQGKSVTKDAIADFVRANQIQVQEVEKGGNAMAMWEMYADKVNDAVRRNLPADEIDALRNIRDDYRDKADGTDEETKFSQWQLPGGENYRELLLTLPSPDIVHTADNVFIDEEETRMRGKADTDIFWFVRGPDNVYQIPKVKAPTEQDAVDYVIREKKPGPAPGAYRGGHYDEPNVLAHIRFNERTDAEGKRVLFIEEVQSDWHQAGRKRGYGKRKEFVPHVYTPEEFEITRTDTQYVTVDNNGVTRKVGKGTVEGEAGAREYFARWLTKLDQEYAQEQNLRDTDKVPEAPFKTTWPLLAMKRMIRYAADNGFDSIAWTTGEQQAERYELSKQIDRIEWALYAGDEVDIWFKKLGEDQKEKAGRFTVEKLPDVIGKELADKVASDLNSGEVNGEYDGEDLKVGGEGMKGFYDSILPKTVNKYVKKWGGKVGETNLAAEATPDEITGEWVVVDEAGRVLTDTNSKKRAQEYIDKYSNPNDPLFLKNSSDYSVNVHALPITDQMREAALAGQPLFQKKRGSIQFGNEKTIINLFKAHNLSTFLHESGHLFLDVYREISSRPDAVSELREEWQRIETAIGLQPNEAITREHHEKFAVFFEAYLREGKAPNQQLRGVFRTYRNWLLQTYPDIKRLLGKEELSDEVRSIFDRMLATNEQIEIARSDGYEAMYEDAASMGVTDAEFADYKTVEQEVHQKAQEELDVEAIKEAESTRKAQWQRARDVVRTQVELEVNQRRGVRAKHFLNSGELLPNDPLEGVVTEPMKLSTADLKAMYAGTDFEYQLRRLPPNAKRKEGGVHPDEVAEIFGYESGDSMVRELVNTSNRNQIIEAETDARMAEEYGDMRTDMARVADMAVEALHSDKRAHFLMMELRALNKRTRTGQTQASVLKQAAQRIVDDTLVPEAARSERYLAAERRLGREAKQALIDEDYMAAQDAKRRQILNHYLYTESRDARRAQRKFLRYFKKFNSPGVRKTLKGDYLDQIDQLLEQYDFRKISEKKVKERQSLRQWVQEQYAEDIVPNIDDKLLDEVKRTSYKELTQGEFQGLYDAVKSIEIIARDTNKVKVAQEIFEYEMVVQELVEAAIENNKVGPAPPMDKGIEGRKGEFKSLARSFDATLLKTEQMIAWLDGDVPEGPWHKYLFKVIADAEHARNDMELKYTVKLIETLESLPKEQSNRLHKTLYVPEIGKDMTYAGLVAMALNMGTESNFDKLVNGSQILEDGGFTRDQATAAVNNHLSEEDWLFVDRVWRLLEGEGEEKTLFHMLNEVEKEMTGTPVKKLEGRKVTTPYGVFQGGYYPIVYSRTESKAGMKRAEDIGEEIGAHSPSTRSGSVHERIEGYSAPLDLDLRAIPLHISEIIQDVTHRRAVKQTWKLVTDQRIRRILQKTLGKEYEAQFQRWVAHVANDRMIDQSGVGPWMRMMRGIRLNTSIVAMGFKYTTMIQQPLGITQSIDTMRNMKGGKTYLAKEVANLSANPKAMKDTIFEKSGEMRHRFNNLDRDLRENLRKRLGRKDVKARMIEMAFKGIAYMDLSVSLPTWMASYKWAIDNHYSEAEAIEWADSRVRLSQGTGSAKDLAAVQRGHEAMKLLTVFYTYFNTYYNRIRDTGRMTETIKDVPDFFLRHWYITMIPAIFSELLSGRGPDEDEEWDEWALRKVIVYPFLTIPLVRDVASAVESGFGYDFTPAAGMGEHTVRLLNKSFDYVQGDAELNELMRQAVRTSGYFLGLPTAQATITFDHIIDVAEGDSDFNPYYLLVREPDE